MPQHQKKLENHRFKRIGSLLLHGANEQANGVEEWEDGLNDSIKVKFPYPIRSGDAIPEIDPDIIKMGIVDAVEKWVALDKVGLGETSYKALTLLMEVAREYEAIDVIDTIIPIIDKHEGDLISRMHVLDDEAAIWSMILTIATFSPEPRAVDFFTDLIEDERLVSDFAPMAFFSLMKDRAMAEKWPEIITSLKPYFDELSSHDEGQVILEDVAQELIEKTSPQAVVDGLKRIDIDDHNWLYDGVTQLLDPRSYRFNVEVNKKAQFFFQNIPDIPQETLDPN